ncbi:hypothetical protein G9A89_006989 [Geosiphon pyriformis]|nr:hypothetical protein G9A89_006989 [Geosiphon pyriformis]
MTVIDKLESDILVLNKLAAASLADKCFDIVPDFVDISEFEIGDWDFYIDFPIIDEIPKSGGSGSNQIPNGIGDCDLNLSKYLPYGPNNSTFLCLLWNGNCPNIDVTFGVDVPADVILIVLPGVTAGVCNLPLSLSV